MGGKNLDCLWRCLLDVGEMKFGFTCSASVARSAHLGFRPSLQRQQFPRSSHCVRASVSVVMHAVAAMQYQRAELALGTGLL